MPTTKVVKRGRPKGTGLSRPKYQVTLDEADAEWAKHQPGGMSAILRTLLREAREDAYWAARAEEGHLSGYVGVEETARYINERLAAE
jgi:hypothetical protein